MRLHTQLLISALMAAAVLGVGALLRLARPEAACPMPARIGGATQNVQDTGGSPHRPKGTQAP